MNTEDTEDLRALCVKALKAQRTRRASFFGDRLGLTLASEDIQSGSADYPNPPGLPPIPWPEDNPYSPARAELGKVLFFDGRLSSNGVVSCAFCHEPAHAFAASTPLSRGVDGKPGIRHTPTLINRAWGKSQFWDGWATTLEAQIVSPITNPDEMGMTTDGVVQKIGSIKTLGQVLDLYAKGGLPNPHLDSRLTPFYLDEETKRALLAFLESLNGEGWQNIMPPGAFPQ